MTIGTRRAILAVGLGVGVVALGGAALLAVRGFGDTAHPSGNPSGNPSGIGGPFTLTSTTGATVTDATFRGRWLLLYFGYTFCPDVCPTTLAQVASAFDLLGADADRVVPAFVTVDPHRDTLPVMQRYVAAFSPRIVGLTGTQAQIDAATREYRIFAGRVPTGPGPDDYTMDHSSFLYLVNPDGEFDRPLHADATAADLADSLRAVLHPKPQA